MCVVTLQGDGRWAWELEVLEVVILPLLPGLTRPCRHMGWPADGTSVRVEKQDLVVPERKTTF